MLSGADNGIDKKVPSDMKESTDHLKPTPQKEVQFSREKKKRNQIP